MTTDFRSLCAELLIALENAISIIYYEDGTKHISTAKPIVNRARTALANEPAVPEGREPVAVTGQPSDEDLLGIACQSIEPYDKIRPGEYEAENNCAIEVYGSELVTFARAVLTRWGNPAPQPPAEGEVAELVRMLTGIAHWRRRGRPGEGDPSPFDIRQADRLDRAADLLQCLTPPQPVPVRIADGVYWRWPEFSDCDDTDRVWCWSWAIGTWRLSRINRSIHSHWLPAHALPIPQQQETVND